MTENFDGFSDDTSYGNTPVAAGFTTWSTTILTTDFTWSIDVAPDRFVNIPNVNGTPFLISFSIGSSENTVANFAPVRAFGFDFGASNQDGQRTVQTSLGHTANFTNTQTSGGFFGLLYDAGESFTSLTWSASGNRSAGLDNVEAYSSAAAIPEPRTFVALFLGLIGMTVHWWRRSHKTSS